MRMTKLATLGLALVCLSVGSALGNPWPPPWSADILYDEDAYSYVQEGEYSGIGSEDVPGGEWYWWHMVFNGVDCTYDGQTYEDDGVMGGFGVYDTACADSDEGNDPHLLDTATYHEVLVWRQDAEGSWGWADLTSAWDPVHEEQSNWVVAWQMAQEGEVIHPGEEVILRIAFDRTLSCPELNAIHARQLGPGDEYSSYVASTFGWYGEPPPGDDAPELGTWVLLLTTGAFGGWVRRRKQG